LNYSVLNLPVALLLYKILTYAQVMEHGANNQDFHISGAMNVVASFGGIENFDAHHPHLRLILAQNSHFETMHLVLSHIPITKATQTSRRMIEALCYDPYVRRAYCISSPPRLTLVVYDMGVLARRLFNNSTAISVADMYLRDGILSDVLFFPLEEGIRCLQETYSDRIEVWVGQFQSF
jgi:hypothetical protein